MEKYYYAIISIKMSKERVINGLEEYWIINNVRVKDETVLK